MADADCGVTDYHDRSRRTYLGGIVGAIVDELLQLGGALSRPKDVEAAWPIAVGVARRHQKVGHPNETTQHTLELHLKRRGA